MMIAPDTRAHLLCPVALLVLFACGGKSDGAIQGEDADGDGVPKLRDCDDSDSDVGQPTPWFQDNDGDLYGNDHGAIAACSPPPGRVAEGGDCDDSHADVSPAENERCDDAEVDEDCDGDVDDADFGVSGTTFWYTDRKSR